MRSTTWRTASFSKEKQPSRLRTSRPVSNCGRQSEATFRSANQVDPSRSGKHSTTPVRSKARRKALEDYLQQQQQDQQSSGKQRGSAISGRAAKRGRSGESGDESSGEQEQSGESDQQESESGQQDESQQEQSCTNPKPRENDAKSKALALKPMNHPNRSNKAPAQNRKKNRATKPPNHWGTRSD